RGGADFGTLARQHSEDPSSSSLGGDMGWVERGATVEPFERGIFSVPLNTISDPIRSAEYGYHIVRVTERRPAGYRSFEEVKPELVVRGAANLAQDQARNEVNRIGLALKDKKPANAQEFIGYANATVTSQDSGWFSKSEQIPGIGNNPSLQEWIFSAEKGAVSGPIGTGRGPVIAYLENVRPAGISAFTEVKEKAEADLKLQKATEAVRGQLAGMMAGAANLDAVAQKAGQTVRDATANRQGPVAGIAGDASELIEAAIKANVGGLNGPITVADGAVVFEVTEQKKVTPKELQDNRAQYVDTLREQQARSLRSSLVTRLRKDSKIEINEQVVAPPPAQQQAAF
ncbi:MAG TPA: peptidyl-prolyl cis-trans isomerase, partial [Thermoanaerobaculia bacterium]|nr:peptidyl-prolyl cis-trans isomerase [Thermoanaerobaculia bacterium]